MFVYILKTSLKKLLICIDIIGKLCQSRLRFFYKVNVLYTKGAFGGRRMSSVVLSARNAVAVYVSDVGTLVVSAKLAFAVMLRFLSVRLLAVALGVCLTPSV